MKKSAILMAMTISAAAMVSVSSGGAVSASAAEEPLVSYWSCDEDLPATIASSTTETYAEESRQWQGLPSVAVTPGGRMWCAWQTGDSVEGTNGPNNYDVLYYSDDGGNTWSGNYMIWDVPEETIRLTDPRLFYDQYGKLWLVLIRGGLNGVYAIELTNPDCANPETELVTGEPISWMKYPPAHRPTILSNGYWITPVQNNVANQDTYICKPNDATGKYAWTTNTTQAAIASDSANCYGEAQIIELQDGRLMMLTRMNKGIGGGMGISYSADYGMTWSPYVTDNGVPYVTPGSKFHIQRLESGAILMITHAVTDARLQLAAYLSYDDGKTWPYRMMLDDSDLSGSVSSGISYPEAAQTQGEHGEIYIVYDVGRFDRKEIRLSIVTEEDVKAGKPVTEYCEMRKNVNATGGYLNYVDTEEDYERYYTVTPGTEKSEILSQLPATVTLVGENGERLSLTGSWECLSYAKNTLGTYTFTFSKSVTGKAQDRYSLLKAYVTVAEESEDPGEDPPPAEDPGTPPDPSDDQGKEDKEPSEGAKVGLIVGVSVAAVVVAGCAVFFLVRAKMKN